MHQRKILASSKPFERLSNRELSNHELSNHELQHQNQELTRVIEQQAEHLATMQQELEQEKQARLRSQAALQVANEELQQRIERQRLKSEIAQQIHESFTIDQILNTAVKQVQQFLQVDRVLIYHFAPDWSGTFVAEAVTAGWTSVLGSSLRDPCFSEKYVEPYRQGRIQIVDDVLAANLAPCHVELLSAYQVKANLVVPIVCRKRLWGLFVVQQCRQPRQWQAWESEFLGHLATKIDIAIEQAELYDQLHELNARLECDVIERTAHLQVAYEFEATLKRITDRVRDSLDEAHILQAAVQELTTTIGVNCCNASLHDLEQKTATIHYEYATLLPPSKQRVFSMENWSDFYNQLQQGDTFQFCFREPSPRRGSVSILASPLMDDQGVLGDLWLIHDPGYTFCELEIRLVKQVANQCAIALRQSRLFQAVQQKVQELEQLNALKDDFLGTVSHELRSPMSNIKLAAQLLEIHLDRLGVLATAPETIQKYLGICIPSASGRRISSMISWIWRGSMPTNHFRSPASI
ncbi:MAG: GAF domain-containing protein [Leptolyngbyaceae cyanobacterium RU_5_1]|nr:GAF domain-containing protein [Leptolyngbyaceae cyanobacterium RU_5_1]